MRNYKGMKKHQWIYFILSFFILCQLFGVITNNASALPTNWIELTDFDEFNIGDVNRTVGDIKINRMYGDDVKIIQNIDTDYIYEICNTVGSNSFGYINNTNHSYFGYYVGIKQNFANYVFYIWYNLSNTAIVTLYTKYGDGVYYQDYEGNYNKIYTLVDFWTEKIYISWQYYTDNMIQYKVLDHDFNVLTVYNGTGKISGENYTSKQQFNSSNSSILSTYVAGAEKAYIYEYGYITEDLETEEECKELDGVIVYTSNSIIPPNYILGVKNVISTSLYRYKITAVGDIGATLFLRIFNASDDVVYANMWQLSSTTESFYPIITYLSYWGTGTFSFNISGYFIHGCGEWYNYSTDFTVTSFYEDELQNLSGVNISSPWAIFDTIYQDYYFTQDDIRFAYYTPKNSSATTNLQENYYIIELRMQNFDTWQPMGIFKVPTAKMGHIQIDSTSFGKYYQSGIYRLIVYNCSNLTTRYQDGEIYYYCPVDYISEPLKVWDKDADDEDNNGIPDDEDPDFEDPDDPVLDSGSYLYYVGLAVSLTIGLVGAYIGGGIGFTGGFIGSLAIFSIPGTPFHFFPTILLFLMGFLFIILFIYFIIRR